MPDRPLCDVMSPLALLVGQSVTLDAPMPEFQPVYSAAIAAIERPRCPNCNQNRMLLSKLGAGPSGFGHRTFECQKCGRVRTTVVSGDPMNSATSCWLAGELRPPR